MLTRAKKWEGVSLAQHAMNMGTGWETNSRTCFWLALWPIATAEAFPVTSVSPVSPCPMNQGFFLSLDMSEHLT